MRQEHGADDTAVQRAREIPPTSCRYEYAFGRCGTSPSGHAGGSGNGLQGTSRLDASPLPRNSFME